MTSSINSSKMLWRARFHYSCGTAPDLHRTFPVSSSDCSPLEPIAKSNPITLAAFFQKSYVSNSDRFVRSKDFSPYKITASGLKSLLQTIVITYERFS